MKRRIPENTWAELRTAFCAGVGLREMARRMDIPAGTVLARSRREGWTAQIQQARNIVPAATASNAPVVADAVASLMVEHGEACRAASLRASRKGLEHLAESDAEAIIARSRDLKSLTESAALAGDWRRQEPGAGSGVVNIALIHMELG